MEYVFVYGTLLSQLNHPLNKKMLKEGILIGDGFVMGSMYDVGEYPAAIPSQESIILGEVYKIPETFFFELDDYEGYNPYNLNDSLYKRKKTKVYLIDKKDISDKDSLLKNKEKYHKLFCWIYWYNKPINHLKKIQENSYIDYLHNKTNIHKI
jgi:gamma-glutamylcyclotransferase (GGCT)/AIG2-like uncharacterized protein YtfP